MINKRETQALAPYPARTPDGIDIKTTTYTTTLPTHPQFPTGVSPLTPGLEILKNSQESFVAQVIHRRLAVNPGRLRTLLCHWRAAQTLMSSTELGILELGAGPEVIYNYFINRSHSPGYAVKVIWLLNKYGEFVDYANFRPIPPPSPFYKERMADAFAESGIAKVSAPLTEEKLKASRKSLKRHHYRWLYISLWLGLRPTEVDALSNPDSFRVTDALDDNNPPVLHVYQSKLRQLPKEKRWKLIPLLLPQQIFALKIIQSGQFRRPSKGTLHRHLGNEIHSYGGRKGFADLLMKKGVSVEAASIMLGHKNLETTLTFYSDPIQVQLERIRRLK